MKRLLYITTDSWWDTDVTIIPQLASEYNMEVFVASETDRSKNKYSVKEVPSGVVLHDVHFVKTQRNPLMLLTSFVYLIRLLFALPGKDYVFWVIDGIIYYSFPFSFFCPKRKTILSLHNYEEHIGGKKQVFNLKEYLLHKFSFFHFHSSIQRDLFLNDFKDKVTFATNMPLKYFGAPSSSIPVLFPIKQRTFLFLGMVRDYKRPDMFLKCAAQYPNANFIIVGYTETPSKYDDLISHAKGNLHVNFSFISNQKIADYFSLADFLVLPYDDATQSGPLLTAFAYNVPVIASDQPIFRRMISNYVDGFLFAAGNQSGLNNCIERAIDLSEDEYIKMCNCQNERVEKYSETTNFLVGFNEFVVKLL